VFALTQIQNLALKECAKEIDVACDALGISAGKAIVCNLVYALVSIVVNTIFEYLSHFFLNY